MKNESGERSLDRSGLLVARYWPAEIQLNDQLSTPTTKHVGDVCTLSTKRETLGWLKAKGETEREKERIKRGKKE